MDKSHFNNFVIIFFPDSTPPFAMYFKCFKKHSIRLPIYIISKVKLPEIPAGQNPLITILDMILL